MKSYLIKISDFGDPSKIFDLTEKEYKQLEAFLFGLRGKEVKDDSDN